MTDTVATVAVITPALAPVPIPNETPPEFENVNAEAFVLVVPAEILMLEIVAALESIAVVRYAGRLTLTPLVLTVIDPPVIAPLIPAYFDVSPDNAAVVM